MPQPLARRPYNERGIPTLAVQFSSRGTGVFRFKRKFMADTGFAGGLKAPPEFGEGLLKKGVVGRGGSAELADGRRTATVLFAVDMEEIDGHRLTPPTSTRLTCPLEGDGVFLLGRELLRLWIAEFNGPRQMLTIKT